MNGHSEQGVRHFKFITNRNFTSGSRQCIGLFGRTIIIREIILKNLMKYNAIIVWDANFLGVQQTNRTLPDRNRKRGGGVCNFRIKDKIFSQWVVADE